MDARKGIENHGIVVNVRDVENVLVDMVRYQAHTVRVDGPLDFQNKVLINQQRFLSPV